MTRTKRALLVGSSFSAAPIYFELKNQGFNVTVCGSLPDDPCHKYADESIYIDYSVREDLLRVAEEGDFDFLVPSCNDYSYLSSSWVANKLGYPGFDTVEVTGTLHAKDLFRQFTQSMKLKSPRYYTADQSRLTDIPLPCLVKPVDAFSGRGVTRVGQGGSLDEAISNAVNSSRRGDYVLEEFVEGTLHSHSAFIRNGEIIIEFFVDEFCTVYPYQVNCSNHPSGLSAEIKSAVHDEMMKVIGVLQLCDGLLHTQFIADHRDFWIIECMRRCPGDLYGQLIERSTGVNYTGLFISPFVSGTDPSIATAGRPLPYGRHTVSTRNEAIYFSFAHEIPCAGIEVIQLKTSGEPLAPAPHDKLAILIIPFANHAAMAAATPNFAEMISVNSLGDPDAKP